ncbi:MAG: glutathione S-transferase [Alphaproteobacteria bacterium]|jgi:glutathione S-transferase|uniref:Glutathione S-transferase n=1 Tax=Brevundimonas mediterranea TaxID=74329 RepID=A0A6G7EJC5_9CAUL|nr:MULTISPECIES: glutathione S-transferase [Brevundimonas]MBU1270730.1 glutathione S-transferase [Alphaproteobacteria bacterium]MDZ4373035.1 glutathione S-transferase [Phenylobacterium sp.]OGN45265.1 MAG: glutathione S-transferase [Caulobacterales bacterium GWE1_67_11]OGN64290.1 MAG: glutathione S-transferase [Caulobacterales bacterium RIFOXYA1_FULL_67_7]EDX78872.1 Glutathione S-transferase, N-terminal domain protein [Brevundimonas sp. BAL3]
MKLYTSHRAPNPRRVRWVMAEKGVEDVELVEIDILTGDHKKPEYRDKVGVPHLPALELDDGTTISESVAIGRYLEALYPEPNLFGRDAREQAVVEMWTRRCEFYLSNPIMLNVRHSHPALAALEAVQIPQVADYNRLSAERFMKTLDRHLAEREFIALDRFTIADIVAVVGLDFARMVRYRPPAEFENLHRWFDACRDRPAAKAGV